MSDFFSSDERFNGPHHCPKCGQPSEWKGISADDRVILVLCRGTCGKYKATYTALQDMPFFSTELRMGARPPAASSSTCAAPAPTNNSARDRFP